MSYRGLALGDLHLDGLANLFPDNHLRLQYKAVTRVIDAELEDGLEHVVFLGDIGEKIRLSSEAEECFLAILDRYDGEVELDIILGNHDVRHRFSHSLSIFVAMLKRKKFKTVRIHTEPTQRVIGGVPVNFLPFPAFKPIPYEKCETLNFGHFARPGCTRDNGTKMTHGGVKQKGRDKFILGHLHLYQEQENNVWPGTLFQKNFGEPLPKGYLRFKVERDGDELDFRHQWREVDPVLKLLQVEAKTVEDIEALETGDNIRYQVFAPLDSEIPQSILENHPCIHEFFSFKNREELRIMKRKPQGGLVNDDGELEYNLLTGLSEWLAEKKVGADLLKSALAEAEKAVAFVQSDDEDEDDDEDEED